MCTRNFNLTSTFFPKWGIFSPKFCILGRKFYDKKIFRSFSDSKKFRVEIVLPTAVLPQRHCPQLLSLRCFIFFNFTARTC